MNVVVVVLKNTASVDYSIPILWGLKAQCPDARISVVYHKPAKWDVPGISAFYSRLLASWGIKEFTILDFIRTPFKPVRAFYNRLAPSSIESELTGGRDLTPSRVKKESNHLLTKVAQRLSQTLGSAKYYQPVLEHFDPDVVLLDNSGPFIPIERNVIGEYIARKLPRVFLLPHAPHHAARVSFGSYRLGPDPLPDYCEFWMPFRFEESWEALPERRHQFVYIGYPGLDTLWLNYLLNDVGLQSRPAEIKSSESMKCLFVVRRFLEKGRQRGSGDDAFVYAYEEFISYLDLMATAIERAGIEIELVVKPHPNNDLRALQEVLRQSCLRRWRITRDPIYACLSEIDLVVSLYSTVFFVPAMAGIPVLVINTSTQQVTDEWDKMKDLYAGFTFFLDSPEQLPERLPEAVDAAAERRRSGRPWDRDVDHLREYYPDGAIGRALARIK